MEGAAEGDSQGCSLMGSCPSSATSPKTVHMTGDNGNLSSATIMGMHTRIHNGKLRWCKGKIMPLALMTGCALVSRVAIQKCHLWPKRGTPAVELSMRMLGPRIGSHLVGEARQPNRHQHTT